MTKCLLVNDFKLNGIDCGDCTGLHTSLEI